MLLPTLAAVDVLSLTSYLTALPFWCRNARHSCSLCCPLPWSPSSTFPASSPAGRTWYVPVACIALSHRKCQPSAGSYGVKGPELCSSLYVGSCGHIGMAFVLGQVYAFQVIASAGSCISVRQQSTTKEAGLRFHACAAPCRGDIRLNKNLR